MAFLPQPAEALATEQNVNDYKTKKGAASTRKPSFSDMMTDSVLNGGGGIYDQMKMNMEKTVERENERI